MADLPQPVRDDRMRLASTLVVHALAERERAPGPAPSLLAAELVDAMVAVLTAPVSDIVRTELRAATRRGA